MKRNIVARSLCVAVYLCFCHSVQANEIAPPKYNLIDRLGVNMATGQVQVSQTDLSIGGAMGLTHTVSQHSSDFFGGFNSNYFRGSAGTRVFLAGGSIADQFAIVRVFGNGTTIDFRYTGSNGNYTYTAVNDPRNELAFVAGTGLVCTLADGTQMIYSASSFDPTLNQNLTLSQIVYPNGLRVTRNHLSSGPMSSVRTNTGWQFKYQYVDDTRALDPAKQNSTMETGMPADSLSWSRGNPKHVVALNNSIEHCPVHEKFCSTNNSWPTTTYQWPAGMPRAMAVENSTFSITDPEGRTTHFNHYAFDKAHQLPNGTWLNGITPGNKSTPRVSSIDLPNSSPINYQYENRVIQNNASAGQGLRYPRWFPDGYAVLYNATHDSESMSYTPVVPKPPGSNTLNNSVGYQAISQIEYNNQKGVMNLIDMADKKVRREDTFYNKIRDVYNKQTGLYHTFDYDSRLNITAIKERDADYFSNPSFEITIARAQYPASCNTSNRKYCNKAMWMEDANGSRTDYTYHAASGQIATITLPPDEDGKRAQTRYTYVQKTPTHSGADHSPVWVLDTEEFCRNSASSGSGCSGSDETVTQYQYETENILMIGKAVTANGTTLRTCYRYDRLGRQIGVTEPNANKSNCSY